MKADEFVSYVIERIKKDNVFCAALKKADNPDTAYWAWEYLMPFCSGNETELQALQIIASALARSKPEKNGSLSISRALSMCDKGNKEGNKALPALARFRRLCSCSSVEEACSVLRPMLAFILSKKVRGGLNYSELLNDLIYFGDGEKVKTKWALDFYPKVRN